MAKKTLKERDAELLKKRAELIAERIKSDPQLMKDLEESRQALRAGDKGIRAKDYFAERGRK